MATGRKSFLVIRLSLRGCTNRPFYHINVMTNVQGRDKKAKYQLGVYDPMPNIHGEKIMSMDFDKLRYFIKMGAQPTKAVSQLLGLSGYFPIHPTTRLKARRLMMEKYKLEEDEGDDEKIDEELGAKGTVF